MSSETEVVQAAALVEPVMSAETQEPPAPAAPKVSAAPVEPTQPAEPKQAMQPKETKGTNAPKEPGRQGWDVKKSAEVQEPITLKQPKRMSTLDTLAQSGVLQALIGIAQQRRLCSEGQLCAMEEYVRTGAKDTQSYIELWTERLGGMADKDVAAAFARQPISIKDNSMAEVPMAHATMDRCVLVTVATGAVHFFAVASGTKISSLQLNFPASAARFAASRTTVLVASPEGIAHVIDSKTREFSRQINLQAGQGPISQMDTDSSGALIAVAYAQDRVACLFDAASGECVKRLEHDDFVAHVALSRDGSRVVTACSDKNIRLFDVATGELLRTWCSACSSLAVCTDQTGARVAVAETDLGLETNQLGRRAWSVRVFDSNDGQVLREIEFWDTIHGLSLSGSGELVAVARSCEMRGSLSVFDTNSGQQVYAKSHQQNVVAVAFDEVDARIATGGGSMATVFDVQSGQLRNAFQHESPVQQDPDSGVPVCAVALLPSS